MIGRRTGRALLALLAACMVMSPLTAAASSTPSSIVTTTRAIEGEPLVPGTTAIVRGAADCLRLRDAPSLSGGRLDCIPEGRTVLVMPGVQEADGYRWQLVSWRDMSGWAADDFLAPYDGPPVAETCQASTIRPGISGDLPSQGGFGLVIWGGGTLQGIETTTAASGCRVSSVWASRPDGGGFVGYRFGAPDFVNQEWNQGIPQTIGAGTPLLIVCDPPGAAISTRSVPIPMASAQAPVRVGATTAPEINARAAVVIDEASGAVLYELNAHQALAPASLTKIATAILALEGAPLNSWIPVTDVDYRRMPGSSVMGIVPGDCFLLTDMLYGLMLPSGNDAALAIARYVGGSDEAFVHQMNTLARRLGLNGTSFTDPHGLGSSSHRTTAYDIAMLSRYAMQYDLFRQIVNAPTWTAHGERELSMRNVNAFLSQFKNADGVKTGFTEEAGRTLSASASRNGKRLYVVILNDEDRNADAAKLLDWAFENFAWQ